MNQNKEQIIEFLIQVGISLFDANLAINLKYQTEIQTLFNIKNILSQASRKQLIYELLTLKAGEDLFVRLIYDQKQVSNLLFKYTLVEPEYLTNEILAYLKADINEMKHQDIDKLANVATGAIRIFQAIEVRKARELLLIKQNNSIQEDIELYEKSIHQSQVQFEEMKGVQSFLKLLVFIQQKNWQYILEDEIRMKLYDNQQMIPQQPDQQIKTLFHHLMIKPYHSDIFVFDWERLDRQEFLQLLSKQSVNQQLCVMTFIFNSLGREQELLQFNKYMKIDNDKQRLFNMMYQLDTGFDIQDQENLTQIQESLSSNHVKELETWKLYICERLQGLNLHQIANFVLSQAYVFDWRDINNSELLIDIFLRGKQYLQCYFYVTQLNHQHQENFQSIFGYFLKQALYDGFWKELFKTSMTQSEEQILISFLTRMPNDYQQHLIMFLLKRGNISLALEQYRIYANLNKNQNQGNNMKVTQTEEVRNYNYLFNQFIKECINDLPPVERQEYLKKYFQLQTEIEEEEQLPSNNTLKYLQANPSQTNNIIEILRQNKNPPPKGDNQESNFFMEIYRDIGHLRTYQRRENVEFHNLIYVQDFGLTRIQRRQLDFQIKG